MDKEKIRPIYSELQGYLSQTPLPDKSDIIHDASVWKQYNESIDELNEVTTKDYSRFRIEPEREVNATAIEFKTLPNGETMVSFGRDSARWRLPVAWYARFEKMRPEIEYRARRAFRDCGPARLEECVADVIDHALQVFLYLAERGMADVAHPKPLAISAIKQVCSARRLPTLRLF